VAKLAGDARAEAIWNLLEGNSFVKNEDTKSEVKVIDDLIEVNGWESAKTLVFEANSAKDLQQDEDASEEARTLRKEALKKEESRQPKYYTVLTASDIEELQKMVQVYLRDSYYVPQGGISVVVNPMIKNAVLWSQAMVCYSPATKKIKKWRK
jgi:hypothetical protein